MALAAAVLWPAAPPSAAAGGVWAGRGAEGVGVGAAAAAREGGPPSGAACGHAVWLCWWSPRQGSPRSQPAALGGRW